MKRSYFKTHGAQWGLKLKTHHWGQKSGTQIENVEIQRRVQDETSETTVRNLINLLSFTRGSLFCQIFWNTIISFFFNSLYYRTHSLVGTVSVNSASVQGIFQLRDALNIFYFIRNLIFGFYINPSFS